jgi:hypothetical protein
VAGLVALRSDARFVYDGLTSDGLPLVIASPLCGAAVLVSLHRGPRPLAAGAVVAVAWGGTSPSPLPDPADNHDRRRRGAARHPHGSPDCVRHRGRRRAATIGLLFTLAQRSLIEDGERPQPQQIGG